MKKTSGEQDKAYRGTGNQDAGVFRNKIASYGTLVDPIITACEFTTFGGPKINFLDAMSGPGKLGLAIREKIPALTQKEKIPPLVFHFNDVRPEPLQHLPDDVKCIQCDVRELGRQYPEEFHIVTVRYGIKDLPKKEQPKALASIYKSMADGARIVVADMTAVDADARDGIISVHAAKQSLAGRDEKREGRCHIPTTYDWPALLMDAGFDNVRITYKGVSTVNTTDWAGQFTRDLSDDTAIPIMNGVIRQVANASAAFRTECAVDISPKQGAPSKPVSELRASEIAVTLSFPIMVIIGDKL